MFNRVPLLAIVCASAAFMGCGAQADSEGSSEDSLTASGESVGVAKQLVCPVDTQTCHPIDNSGDFCAQSNWTFESSPMHFWNNSAETNSALSNARHQGATGSWSLKVTPSSDPLHYPARVLNLLCTYDTVGTLNAVGKTYSAYVYVPNIAGTNYANTSCRLRAFDNNFNASSISGQQAITPGTWMHLQAVFSNSTVNQHIYEIAVDCSLPSTWLSSDASKGWFVDNAKVF